jgi:hypothetical protein
MKLPAATALALLAPLLAPADWVMENQIENPSRRKIVATVKSKGDKFRVDVAEGPQGAVSTILDTAAGEIVQLAHDRKEARKTSSEKLKQRLGEMRKNAPSASIAVLPKPTGEKEKIGDWECAIYAWENDTTSAKLWLATNIPKAGEIKAMMEKLNSGGFGGAQSGPDTAALPGVVVKTESITGAGKSTMSVVSIKEQDVKDSEFDVPADYEVKTPQPRTPRRVPSAPSGAPGIEKKGK